MPGGGGRNVVSINALRKVARGIKILVFLVVIILVVACSLVAALEPVRVEAAVALFISSETFLHELDDVCIHAIEPPANSCQPGPLESEWNRCHTVHRRKIFQRDIAFTLTTRSCRMSVFLQCNLNIMMIFVFFLL